MGTPMIQTVHSKQSKRKGEGANCTQDICCIQNRERTDKFDTEGKLYPITINSDKSNKIYLPNV